MGGVGDEVSLRLERSVEPPEQVIEGVAEPLELVVGAVEGEALSQAGGRDSAGGGGDGPDGPQHPAGDQPAGQEGEHGHDGQSDSRVDQQLVRVRGALGGLDGPGLGHLVDGLGQLVDRRCQLMLVLGQLLLVLGQL